MLGLVILILVFVALGVWYELRSQTQYEYICPNCGAARTSFIPPRSKRRNSCLVCSHHKLILARSKRGRTIQKMFHGAASAERHFGKLFSVTETVRDSLRSSDSAATLETLVRLVKDGAFPPDEWNRVEALIRDKPPDQQAEAIRRISELYQSHQAGKITRRQFDQEKWLISPRTKPPPYTGSPTAK